MYVFVRTYFIKNYLHGRRCDGTQRNNGFTPCRRSGKPIGYFDKKYGETGGKIWRKIPNY